MWGGIISDLAIHIPLQYPGLGQLAATGLEEQGAELLMPGFQVLLEGALWGGHCVSILAPLSFLTKAWPWGGQCPLAWPGL